MQRWLSCGDTMRWHRQGEAYRDLAATGRQTANRKIANGFTCWTCAVCSVLVASATVKEGAAEGFCSAPPQHLWVAVVSGANRSGVRLVTWHPARRWLVGGPDLPCSVRNGPSRRPVARPLTSRPSQRRLDAVDKMVKDVTIDEAVNAALIQYVAIHHAASWSPRRPSQCHLPVRFTQKKLDRDIRIGPVSVLGPRRQIPKLPAHQPRLFEGWRSPDRQDRQE